MVQIVFVLFLAIGNICWCQTDTPTPCSCLQAINMDSSNYSSYRPMTPTACMGYNYETRQWNNHASPDGYFMVYSMYSSYGTTCSTWSCVTKPFYTLYESIDGGTYGLVTDASVNASGYSGYWCELNWFLYRPTPGIYQYRLEGCAITPRYSTPMLNQINTYTPTLTPTHTIANTSTPLGCDGYTIDGCNTWPNGFFWCGASYCAEQPNVGDSNPKFFGGSASAIYATMVTQPGISYRVVMDIWWTNPVELSPAVYASLVGVGAGMPYWCETMYSAAHLTIPMTQSAGETESYSFVLSATSAYSALVFSAASGNGDYVIVLPVHIYEESASTCTPTNTITPTNTSTYTHTATATHTSTTTYTSTPTIIWQLGIDCFDNAQVDYYRQGVYFIAEDASPVYWNTNDVVIQNGTYDIPLRILALRSAKYEPILRQETPTPQTTPELYTQIYWDSYRLCVEPTPGIVRQLYIEGDDVYNYRPWAVVTAVYTPIFDMNAVGYMADDDKFIFVGNTAPTWTPTSTSTSTR